MFSTEPVETCARPKAVDPSKNRVGDFSNVLEIRIDKIGSQPAQLHRVTWAEPVRSASDHTKATNSGEGKFGNGTKSLSFKQMLKEFGEIFEGEVSFGLQAKLKVGVGSVGLDGGSTRSGFEKGKVKHSTTQGAEVSLGVKNLAGVSAGGKKERSGHPQTPVHHPITHQRTSGQTIPEYLQHSRGDSVLGANVGPVGWKAGGDVKVEFGAAVLLGVEVRFNVSEMIDFGNKWRQ